MANINDDLETYLNSFYSPEELQESVRRQRKTGVYDPTMANNLNLARDRWNAARRGSGSTAGELSYPELSMEAQKLLARDQSRLAGSNYPAYKGRTTVPMSSLTQRQRELQSQFGAKGAPYAKKLETVLNRNAQGLSPDQTQSLLDMLRTGQGAANENLGLGYMQKQFGERYGNREQRLREKGTKDLARVSNTSKSNLEQLGNNIKGYENTYNENLANTLRGLQGVKQNRREKLTGLLGEYGNQKHAYGNLVNDVNKGEFNRQVNEPYRKMELLQNLIQGQGNNEGLDPGVEAANHRALQQGLKAYGIDTSKPRGEWEKNRVETPKYPGQLVADLSPEITTSHNLAERISPKWQEATFAERKRLEKEAMNKESLGTRATAKLPEAIRPYEENLDWATKKMIKNELGKLNRKYEGLGTYGSQAHLGAVEKRQRELLRSAYGERENLLKGVLGRNVLSEGNNDINELRKLVQLGQLSKDEFDDIIKKNKELNQLGTTKFGNEQNKLGGEYQNYQNELSWEWPNLRQSILGEIGNKKNANNVLQQNYNLDLDYLRNQQAARFSELEKESRNALAQKPVINKDAYHAAMMEEQARANRQAQIYEENRKAEALRRQQEAQKNAGGQNSKLTQENTNVRQSLLSRLNKLNPVSHETPYSPAHQNFGYAMENIARDYGNLTGIKPPQTGAGGWSGNYSQQSYLPMYNQFLAYAKQ